MKFNEFLCYCFIRLSNINLIIYILINNIVYCVLLGYFKFVCLIITIIIITVILINTIV